MSIVVRQRLAAFMRCFPIVVLLLCTCSQVRAEDWYYIGIGAEGGTTFFDVEQMTISGNIVRARVRNDLKERANLPEQERKRAQLLNDMVFDCAGKKFALAQTIALDSNGAVLETDTTSPDKLRYMDSSPGALRTALFDFACGRAKELAPKVAQRHPLSLLTPTQ